MFIEVESLSSKKWLVNIQDIVMIEERTEFNVDEVRSIPLLDNIKECCTIIIRGRSETFWVKSTYKEIKKLLSRYESSKTNPH